MNTEIEREVFKMMTMIFASIAALLSILILVYGFGLFCALWDEHRPTTPAWMYRYLAWVFPSEGWDEEEDEEN